MKKGSPTPTASDERREVLGAADSSYASAMVMGGLRLTPQRRHVHDILMEKRDHPTATEVFLRVQKRMPSISLATVYNCLETMVGNGLVKAVHVDREPTRYCANLREHGHFHCTACGLISDVEFAALPASTDRQTVPASGGWMLPPGFIVTQKDISLRGLCAECSESGVAASNKIQTSQ
ncbi:MAG: transcriptional repressor [bacterium]